MGKDERFDVAAELVFQIGAYQVRPEKPFIYVSRILGIDYTDVRRFIWKPSERTSVTNLLRGELQTIHHETGKLVDFLVGMESADIPFLAFVSERLGLPMAFVRKEEKGHGQQNRIVGSYEGELKGKYGLHLGDLSTKATSAKEVAGVVRAEDAILDTHLVVVDRDQGAEQELAALNPAITLRYLTRMNEQFYRIGIKCGSITEGDYEQVKVYRSNPKKWAHEFLRKNPDYLKECLAPHVKNGEIKRYDALEVLTKGYPELVPEFTERVQGWLKDLGVKNAVPEFGYNATA